MDAAAKRYHDEQQMIDQRQTINGKERKSPMKTALTVFLLIIAAIACSSDHAWAGHGGGKRGGGGGGGTSRPAAPNTNRTPSFSSPRPTTRPATRPSLPNNAGGGRHVGGFSGAGGGMSRPAAPNINRTPSFSSPRPATRPATPGNIGGNSGFNQPSTLPATRPSLPNNAGRGLAKPNYPNFNDRPGGGNNAVNRPSNIGNNTHINRPNNNVNINNLNRSANFNNINAAHYPGIANRPIDPHYGVRPNYGNWYHGDWHGNWGPGWYHRPAAWWGSGFIAGAAVATTPWNWGYWSYYNPYCGAPLIVDGTTIDYAQPIVMAESPATMTVNDLQAPPNADQPTSADRAMAIFATARQAFYDQDYATALKQDEQALALLPSDAVLNEFRGVTLFAMKKYKEAAGVVYAVLSVGPGWDWTTLSALYPNVEIYTAQLRALEDYVRANPNDPAACFLLAYQYLTCGYTDNAAAQLKDVVKLNPKDTLSSQLLQGLTDKEPAPMVAAEQAGPEERVTAKPVAAASLTGSWKAARPDGSTFALTLAQDGKFTWKFAQKDKIQQFSGPYAVADNLLILKQNENPVMVGHVTSLGANEFNFKLPGENPNDPGLTFSK
jgi:tetratricopeptide (TPR) repeat protein